MMSYLKMECWPDVCVVRMFCAHAAYHVHSCRDPRTALIYATRLPN